MYNTSHGWKFKNVVRLLDFPYPLFKYFIQYEVYRYLITGAICLSINTVIFHLVYYSTTEILIIDIPVSVKAIVCSFIVTLLVGFTLNYLYVFPKSNLKILTQVCRFLFSNLLAVVASTVLLNLLVEELNWNVTFGFLLVTILVQTANFFVQRNYSFKAQQVRSLR